MPPDGHYLQTGPTVGGPWFMQPAAILASDSTVDCEVLSRAPDGTPLYPGVDFTDGTCFRVEATVPDTDTHGRVVAYSIDFTNSGEALIVEVPSNVIPLPEPDGAWGTIGWVLLVANLYALWRVKRSR